MGSKMIIVKSKGYVDTSRGPRVYAPISRPYREKTEVILRMITVSKADVYEVLPDKTEVKLDVTNYDKDNYIIAHNIKCETPKVESTDETRESKETLAGNTQLSGGTSTTTVEKTTLADKIPTERQFDPSVPGYGLSIEQEPKFMESLSDNDGSSEDEATVQTLEPITEGDILEEVSDQDTNIESDAQNAESWKQNKRNKKHNKH